MQPHDDGALPFNRASSESVRVDEQRHYTMTRRPLTAMISQWLKRTPGAMLISVIGRTHHRAKLGAESGAHGIAHKHRLTQRIENVGTGRVSWHLRSERLQHRAAARAAIE
jgi:hypothetical protein